MHVEWSTKLRRHGSTNQLQMQSGEVSVVQANAKLHIWLVYGADLLSALQTGERLFCVILRKPFLASQPPQGLSC